MTFTRYVHIKKALSAPTGMAKIPVLFHLGEVSDSVYKENYFYRIINVGDYLL